MAEDQIPLPDIEWIIQNDPDVLSEKNGNAKGLILLQKFHYDLSSIMKKTGVSKSGIYRAKAAKAAGYDIATNGRHRKLCERDESIIVHWALTLIDMGETHTHRLPNII